MGKLSRNSLYTEQSFCCFSLQTVKNIKSKAMFHQISLQRKIAKADSSVTSPCILDEPSVSS